MPFPRHGIPDPGFPIPELRRVIVSDGRTVSMQPTLEEAVDSLAGTALAGSRPATPDRPDAPSVLTAAQALDLLDRAERRLRQGDYAGFGNDLRELRRVLEEME